MRKLKPQYAFLLGAIACVTFVGFVSGGTQGAMVSLGVSGAMGCIACAVAVAFTDSDHF